MSAVASTTTGRLQGEERPGLLVFRGIPYAQPPVGELRFRAPVPPLGWSGTRDATRPGPTSLQVLGMMRDLEPQDEDCLRLNVWTTGLRGRRPVMVWIHGGAFTSGASTHSMYECSELARRGELVVVSFNYRLGALGYADIGALGEAGFACDTNLGLRDQIAALRWVQDNIAAFGGDPEQVTVFGQSAGGMSVSTLLASSASRGLFARAIAQSGAGHHVARRSESAKIAQRLVDKLGLGPAQLDRLRTLPAAEITAAQTACLSAWSSVGRQQRPLRNASMTLVPVIDGELVPQLPVEAVEQARAIDVPLLLGSTLDEWTFWLFLTDVAKRDLDDDGLLHVVDKRVPGRGARVIEAYRSLLGEVEPWRVYAAFETDRVFAMPALQLARARLAATSSTFLYSFEWSCSLFEGEMGACHTIDVPFVLGTVDGPFGRVFTGGGADAQALSARVMDAWIAFARGGDPSCDALGEWPRVRSEDVPCMQLGPKCAVGAPPHAELIALWDELI